MLSRILFQIFNSRAVKSEIEELEEVEKERDTFYELKISEMNEFGENVKRFLTETRTRMQELRNSVNEATMVIE
ncbi:hypothetical protein ES319_D12G193600v1 [Gossypium barbadense]|uniref:Uncharacterized protein n=1 Tax=Gossypium barbadense TaxID=3634 RepID=A0A5J5P145_GOSBA|nr:hypothetical protein ES319_D12G193600v1 [Gossypium barbadense]